MISVTRMLTLVVVMGCGDICEHSGIAGRRARRDVDDRSDPDDHVGHTGAYKNPLI